MKSNITWLLDTQKALQRNSNCTPIACHQRTPSKSSFFYTLKHKDKTRLTDSTFRTAIYLCKGAVKCVLVLSQKLKDFYIILVGHLSCDKNERTVESPTYEAKHDEAITRRLGGDNTPNRFSTPLAWARKFTSLRCQHRHIK